MSRTDHPAFVTARTQNRHLRVVEPPAPHEGNAIAGAFCAVVVLLCVVGLVWLALAGCSATPEQQPCNACTISEGFGK